MLRPNIKLHALHCIYILQLCIPPLSAFEPVCSIALASAVYLKLELCFNSFGRCFIQNIRSIKPQGIFFCATHFLLTFISITLH